MAMNLSLAGACDAIRVGAAQVLGNGNNFASPVGTTQMLLDSKNRANFNVTAEMGQTGHYKKVTLNYMQRALPDEVRTAKSCDPGTSTPRLTDDFNVSLYREVATTVAEDDIRVLCEQYSEFVRLGRSASAAGTQLQIMREVAEQLYLKEHALAIRINQAVNVALAALVGTYQGGATTNTYTLMQSDNYAMIAKGLIDMRFDLSKLGMAGRPFVSGAGILEKAMLSGEYGCCNDLGQDFGRMWQDPGFNFYRDEYVGDATVLNNANGFFAVAPGSAQLVTYNQYVGRFAGEMIGTDVVRGTMPSTYFPGVNYDVRIFADGCAETYTVIMGLWFDVFALPLDLFKVGDYFRGINGVVKGIAAAYTPA